MNLLKNNCQKIISKINIALFLTISFLRILCNYGIPNSKMLILCDRIFEASENAMNYMNKHIDRMPPSADELQTQIDKITFEIVNTADASQKQILKDKYSELQESRDKLRYDDDFEIETDEETEQDRILRQQRKLSRSYDFVRRYPNLPSRHLLLFFVTSPLLSSPLVIFRLLSSPLVNTPTCESNQHVQCQKDPGRPVSTNGPDCE